MGTTWELDFYSRPILDDDGKKLWEVAICESPTEVGRSLDDLFRFSRYCSSGQVNSAWLGQAMTEAMAAAPEPPMKIRFFRRQMKNMITKACKDLGLQPVPSRRTIALHYWLEERQASVYPQHPGYQPPILDGAMASYQPTIPQPLPDALEGQKWAIATLEAGAFAEMADWAIDFGEVLPLSLMNLSPETPVPGLLLFSSRAFAIAGWISGLELATLRYNTEKGWLVLETGFDDAWILEKIANPQVRQEAEGFETTKQRSQGLHFLAVQTNPESESFAGFWLMQDLCLE